MIRQDYQAHTKILNHKNYENYYDSDHNLYKSPFCIATFCF